MRRLLVLLVLVLVGCAQHEQPAQPASNEVAAWKVPADVLPRPDDPEWRFLAMEEYVAQHRASWGDDDQPSKTGDDDIPACDYAGPPACKRISRVGTMYCQDACGEGFYQLSDGSTCVDASSGNTYECDGFAGR